ncbi:hypothetical protein ACFXTI_006933 [Malus domestica]
MGVGLSGVELPHHSLMAGWLGLGPVELFGWQQLPCFGLGFGPAVQFGLLLQWVGPPTLGLLWQLPSFGFSAHGLGNRLGPPA